MGGERDREREKGRKRRRGKSGKKREEAERKRAERVSVCTEHSLLNVLLFCNKQGEQVLHR